jgi:hypothetical protein
MFQAHEDFMCEGNGLEEVEFLSTKLQEAFKKLHIERIHRNQCYVFIDLR